MSDTQTEELTGTTDLRDVLKKLGGPDWLVRLRAAAAQRFEAASWPSTSEEEWRRTSLRAFDFDVYRFGTGDGGASAHGAVAIGDLPEGVAGHLKVADGRVQSAGLRESHANSGVYLGPLSRVSDAVMPVVRGEMERVLERADNRLQLWNLALAGDPAVLYVPRRVAVAEPVVIEFTMSGDEVVRSSFVLVILEEGASATVVRRTDTSEDGEVLVLEGEALTLGDNASLSFLSLQRLNDESLLFSNGQGRLRRDARIRRTEAHLGADFVKSRFACDLEGAGADAALNGMYFATAEQHVDLRTVQSHVAPRTSSRAYYRGAVRGESHAIYQGLISVSEEARGTDAYLTSRNLILSEDARADSIPSLNISTDDVKCSHGSTTGKLNESQLFYLMARGYREEEARLTLIEGYFEDVITRAPELVHEEIRELVARRLVDD